MEVADNTRRRLPSDRATTAGLGGGLAVAAVVLAVVAFVERMPPGVVSISGDSQLVTEFSVVSMVLVLAVAAGVLGIAVAVATGITPVRSASVVLAVAMIGCAAIWLGPWRDRVLDGRVGSDAHRLTELIVAAWILLVVGGLVVLVGVVFATARARTPSILPLISIGVVVATGFTGAVIVATPVVENVDARYAAPPSSIPPMLDTVGDDVAYSVRAVDGSWLVPAGPGFVTRTGDDLIAFDGDDGAERWRLPLSVFPSDCRPEGIQSTGTAPDAIVIVDCRRQARASEEHSTLVGVDAGTGEVRWANPGGWRLSGQRVGPPDLVAVSRDDQVIALDPHSGDERWRAPVEMRCAAAGDVAATSAAVVHVADCDGRTTVELLRPSDGDARSIDLPRPQGRGGAERENNLHIVAVDGNTVVVNYRAVGVRPTFDVDTTTATARLLESGSARADRSSESVGATEYLGTVVELQPDTHRNLEVVLYSLMTHETVRTTAALATRRVSEGLVWGRAGNSIVTAATVDAESRPQLSRIGSDGNITRSPSPCGDDVGGVLAVPGAMLVVCARTQPGSDRIRDHDLVALR